MFLRVPFSLLEKFNGGPYLSTGGAEGEIAGDVSGVRHRTAHRCASLSLTNPV